MSTFDFPPCPNSTRRRGCGRSDIILLGEGDDSWTFRCRTCELIWVVSKPSAAMRGRLRDAEEAHRRRAEALRARDKKARIFI